MEHLQTPDVWLTLGGGYTYNGNIHALMKAANGVVITPLQVRRATLGTQAQPLPSKETVGLVLRRGQHWLV